MINEYREFVVYTASIDHGPDEGGETVDSVHDTYDGASKALKLRGFRPSNLFGVRGEVYTYNGQSSDEYPKGLIDEWVVSE